MAVLTASVTAAKPQCREKVEKRKGTWCSSTAALQYVVVARVITGPFLPQVWKIKYCVRSERRAEISHPS